MQVRGMLVAHVLFCMVGNKGKLDKGTHSALKQMFRKNKNPDYRLRALWALHITDGFKRV